MLYHDMRRAANYDTRRAASYEMRRAANYDMRLAASYVFIVCAFDKPRLTPDNTR
jgi:hypothetical protein